MIVSDELGGTATPFDSIRACDLQVQKKMETLPLS
jgi:hypothetical protein